MFGLVQPTSCIDDTTGTKCVTFLDTKHSTVRCSDSELLHVDLLVDNDAPCCDRCMHYRSTLRALVSRSEKRNTSESDPTDPSSHTPFRHLNTPEKARRYQCEHSLRISCQQRIACRSEQLSTRERVCWRQGSSWWPLSNYDTEHPVSKWHSPLWIIYSYLLG